MKVKKGIYSLGGIIILLIAAFIFVLVPAMAGGNEANRLPEYGSYNGEPIRFEEGSEFYQRVQQTVRQMEQQGYDFNQEYSSFYHSLAFNQAFSQVIVPMALRDMASSTGWLPTDSSVDRILIEEFYNEAGEFSQAKYNTTPDATKRENQTLVTKFLEQQRSYEDIFGSFQTLGQEKLFGMKASSGEIEFIRRMGSSLHGFDYVAFDLKVYPDEKVKEYAEANSEKFEKYDLSVLTFDEEAKAKDAFKRLSNSEITFEDAVTEYSTKMLGDTETGKLNTNRKHQIAEEIQDEKNLESVLSLEEGKLSAPVKIAGGWAIFRADGAKVAGDFNDAEELAEVNTYIFANERGIVEDYYTAIANDFAAAAATTNFLDAASRFNKTRGVIAPFAPNYNNTTLIGKSAFEDISEFNGAAKNENFLKTAFALKEGEISSPILLAQTNSIVVLRCASIEEGGTSQEDALRLIGEEIENADSYVMNEAIQNSPKTKSNSSAFMAKFLGTN